jgi:hypothetical protein
VSSTTTPSVRMKSLAQLEEQVRAWNRKHKPGTPVIVRTAEGIATGPTCGQAFLLHGVTPVVMVHGVMGHFHLDRVEVIR